MNDERAPAGSRSSAGRGRAATAVTATAAAAIAIVAAGTMAVAALRSSTDPPPPTVIEPAVASTSPATVAPRPPAAAAGEPTTSSSPPVPAPLAPAPLSPLASVLPPRLSARPEPPVAAPAPVGLTIARLDVAGAPVVPVAVDAEGALGIPAADQVGWYALGSRPGRPGSTVLVAHINYNRRPGVFERLGELEPGDQAVVALDDGTTRTYEVVERTSYAKGMLPAERVWRTDGDEVLVLITCGGQFDARTRHYADNIVVYLVPVA